MDQVDLVRELRPVRLPDAFVQLGWQDYLAAAVVGVVLAILVAAALTPLIRSRASRWAVTGRRLRTFRSLPAPIRLLRQAWLARELAHETGAHLPPDLDAQLRAALYRPGAAIDQDVLDDAIRDLARRRSGG